MREKEGEVTVTVVTNHTPARARKYNKTLKIFKVTVKIRNCKNNRNIILIFLKVIKQQVHVLVAAFSERTDTRPHSCVNTRNMTATGWRVNTK